MFEPHRAEVHGTPLVPALAWGRGSAVTAEPSTASAIFCSTAGNQGLEAVLPLSLFPLGGLESLCLAPLPRELGREAASCQIAGGAVSFVIARWIPVSVSLIWLNCFCVSAL